MGALSEFFRGSRLLQLSSERVIAEARLLLTGLAWVAFYLDPPDPARNAPALIGVLTIYFGLAGLAALRSLRAQPGTTEQVVAHGLDICFIITLMALGHGITSPFFLFFTFVLLTAMLRWQSQGALLTAALLLLLFFMVIAIRQTSLSLHSDELNRVVIRGGSLFVVAAMLTYVGAVLERSRTRLAKLAAWPGPRTGDDDAFGITSALEHASGMMQCSRVLVVWEETEEPFKHVALWTDGKLHLEQHRSDHIRLVAPGLEHESFRVSSRGKAPVRKNATSASLIDPDLAAAYNIKDALTAPFSNPLCSGRVFLLDCRTASSDDVLLTSLIATRIGVRLEHGILRQQLQTATTMSERVRLARDLHDGVLQGLAAASMHLSLASKAGDQALEDKLNQTRRLLSEEQTRIRGFVEELRSMAAVSTEPVEVAPELKRRVGHLHEQWGCDVQLNVIPPTLRLGPMLVRHIRHLMTEAVSNAARHGDATHVKVTIRREGNRISMRILDNGKGFDGLSGSFGSNELERRQIGPMSIRTRVHELGGTLSLVSESTGSEIQIEVPVS